MNIFFRMSRENKLSDYEASGRYGSPTRAAAISPPEHRKVRWRVRWVVPLAQQEIREACYFLSQSGLLVFTRLRKYNHLQWRVRRRSSYDGIIPIDREPTKFLVVAWLVSGVV
jgi:hypothetical protein